MKKKILFVALSTMALGAFAISKSDCCTSDDDCEPKICCPDKPNCCETKALTESDFDSDK